MARRPRTSVNDRPPKWKLFLRRQRWLLRPLAWCVVALVATGAGMVLFRNVQPGSGIAAVRARIGVMTADAGMRIRDIRIEGRANTPEALLLERLGVNQGDPIVGFSLDQARMRIERLTWVKSATVERRLPGTIAVVLWERRPFAVWQNQGRFVLIDRDGEPVTDEEVTKFSFLPLIVGPGAPKAARVLLEALADRPEIQARLLAATRISERRWNMRMKNGTDILLPEGHEVEALNRLVTLQQETALLDRPVQAIDMRLPDKLVLRPQGMTPAMPLGAQQRAADPSGGEKPVQPPPAAPPAAAKKPT